MGIPRRLVSDNAMSAKNPSIHSINSDAFREADEETETDSELPSLDEILSSTPVSTEVSNDVFESEDVNPSRATIEENVANLDEDELDKLLGLDDLDDDDEIVSDNSSDNDDLTLNNDLTKDDDALDDIIFDTPHDNNDSDTDDNADEDDLENLLANAYRMIEEEPDTSTSEPKDNTLSDDISDEESGAEDDALAFDDDIFGAATNHNESSDDENEDTEEESNEIVFDFDDTENEDSAFSEEDRDDSDNDELVFFDDEDEEDTADSPDAGTNNKEDNGVSDLDQQIAEAYRMLEEEDDEENDDNEDWAFEEIDDEEDQTSDNSSNEEDVFSFANENEEDSVKNTPEDDGDAFSALLDEDKENAFEEATGEEDADNNNEEGKPDEKPQKNGSLKKKFNNWKNKVMADIKGEEPPSDDEDDEDNLPSNADDDNSSDDEKDEESSKKKPSEKKSGSTISALGNAKFVKPFKDIYMKFVKFFFGIINGILGFLSKLPLVGKVFGIALSASKVIEKIALFMPIVFLIGVLVVVSYFSIARSYSSDELPDEGGIKISQFKYSDGKSSANIENTGDVILDRIQVKFSIYSLQPEVFKPKSWVVPQKIKDCVSSEVSVDIDGNKKVSVECKNPGKGFWTRTNGVLNE